MLHLQSVRLAIPARVVMGTWGISPFMLKMRSRGRVNAQAAQYHQSLPIRHISKVLQNKTNKQTRTEKWPLNVNIQRDWKPSYATLFLTGLQMYRKCSAISSLLRYAYPVMRVQSNSWLGIIAVYLVLQCHNCITDVDNIYRPHSKPAQVLMLLTEESWESCPLFYLFVYLFSQLLLNTQHQCMRLIREFITHLHSQKASLEGEKHTVNEQLWLLHELGKWCMRTRGKRLTKPN